jgi:hypothetical protein
MAEESVNNVSAATASGRSVTNNIYSVPPSPAVVVKHPDGDEFKILRL